MAKPAVESDVEWTIGSHLIELGFPKIYTGCYIVKYKKVGDQKTSIGLKAENNKLTINNLIDDTAYEISVYIEDASGIESLCFKAQKRTHQKSDLSALLKYAKQDKDTLFLYHLEPVALDYKYGNCILFRRFHSDLCKEAQISKTILLLGGVSTGKTTLVNAMTNHFLGVEYADAYRFSVTGEVDAMNNSGLDVVMYKIAPPNTSKYKWNLNVVDVRGLKPGQNKRTLKSLHTFLEENNVDLFCLVVTSASRLTSEEQEILLAAKAALSLVSGPGIKFVPLVTYYSGNKNLALELLKEADIPYHDELCFYFNNAQINNQERFDTWKDRNESLGKLLSQLGDLTILRSKGIYTKFSRIEPQKNQVDFETKASHNSITITLLDVQDETCKIKYKENGSLHNNTWKEETFDKSKLSLKGLKGDTWYDIGVFKVVEQSGDEIKVGTTKVKTQPSKAVQYQMKALRDKESSHLYHPDEKYHCCEGYEVRTVPSDGLPSRKEEKTILLLGSPGCGKKTIVDAMINHIFGVEFGDEFRFCLTKTENKMGRKKQVITLFRISPPNESILQYMLNIVVVPSFKFKQEQQSKEIRSNLRKLLDSDKVQTINFACIVVPSTCRLTEDQRLIFRYIISFIGRDVSFLVPLITFHDGGSNSALEALKTAKVPYFDHLYFNFNNASLLSPNESFRSWEKRNDVLKNFFTEIQTTPYISVKITKDVLASLDRIEAISNEEEKIRLRVKEIRTEMNLRRKEDSNVPVRVQEKKIERTVFQNINCTSCHTTCKTNCRRIWGWFWYILMLIEAMCCNPCGNGNLLNCECKCRLGEHVIENLHYADVEILSYPNVPENKTDEKDNEMKALFKRYKHLYKQVKSEIKLVKTNALKYSESLFVGHMETFLNGEVEKMNCHFKTE